MATGQGRAGEAREVAATALPSCTGQAEGPSSSPSELPASVSPFLGLTAHLFSPSPRLNPLLVNKALLLVTSTLDEALPFLLQKIVRRPPHPPGREGSPHAPPAH